MAPDDAEAIQKATDDSKFFLFVFVGARIISAQFFTIKNLMEETLIYPNLVQQEQVNLKGLTDPWYHRCQLEFLTCSLQRTDCGLCIIEERGLATSENNKGSPLHHTNPICRQLAEKAWHGNSMP